MSEGTEPGRVSSRKVHDGRILKLSVDTVRFPDGSTGEREVVRHPGAAAVLPLVTSAAEADPEILLVRQYRYAPGSYLCEVPAGLPDSSDEPWEDCARRELEEETGYRAARITPLTRLHSTPGFTDIVVRMYLAEGLTPGESRLDDDEFVEVVRVRFSRALEMVREGEITDCKTVAALLYAAAFVVGRGPAVV